MLNNPDLIIYLWLIPIFLFLILPLILAFGKFLLNLTRRLAQDSKTKTKEKRLYPRISSLDNTVAEIFMGDTTCTGLICNISKFGIKLKDIPEKFSDKFDKLTIVFRKYGVDHNLTIEPKWVSKTDSGQQMGAKIAAVPSGWGDFISHSEQVSHS